MNYSKCLYYFSFFCNLVKSNWMISTCSINLSTTNYPYISIHWCLHIIHHCFTISLKLFIYKINCRIYTLHKFWVLEQTIDYFHTACMHTCSMMAFLLSSSLSMIHRYSLLSCLHCSFTMWSTSLIVWPILVYST